MNTKQEELKLKLITRFIDLVNKHDGDPDDLKLADELLKSKPEIYVYVSGGNVQGISASCEMEVNIFDVENYEAGDNSITPEQWQEDIDRMEANNEIIGVY